MQQPTPVLAQRSSNGFIARGQYQHTTQTVAAARFLASDESSFMTGSDMVVDGGVSNV
jgi:NAD(P)-dependent dehydrogenase (short-subunit alcohol dehydrogenase family)